MLNDAPAPPDPVRTTVLAVLTDLREEAAESGSTVSPDPVTDATPLTQAGMGSLLLARLIIALEAELGVDPFAEDVLISDVRTVGELVAVYREALTRQAVAP
jgi:acyl carrier protein